MRKKLKVKEGDHAWSGESEFMSEKVERHSPKDVAFGHNEGRQAIILQDCVNHQSKKQSKRP